MSLIICVAALAALLAATTPATTPAAASLLPPPSAAPCPCADPALCRPVQTTHQREVFGFSVDRSTPYDRYDWSHLTTVAWNEDPALLCAAHAAGARVVLDGHFNPHAVLGSAVARTAWVAAQLDKARRLHLDGINFDLEDPIPLGHPLARNYTALVAQAAAAFHAAIPGSQVSVDVPWSPYGIDGRSYDWQGLAQAADLLFVMAYDMQSQIWGSCVASANAPAALVLRGAQQWLELGMPADKLVLGLPWYGYRYPCTNPAFAAGQEQLCALQPTPFQGAPCSDAAGAQLCYSDIAAAVRRGSGGSGSHAGNGGGSRGGGSASRSSNGKGSSSGSTSGQGGSSSNSNGGRQLAEGAVQPLPSHQPAAKQALQGDLLVCEPPEFDVGQQSPYTACRWEGDPPGTRRFQVWFDSPDSLAAKYELAAQLGLRGVGIWHLDCLDYHCTDAACRNETGAMWAALRVFTGAAESGGRPAELKAAGQGQKQATAGAAAARLVVQQAAQRRRVESGMAAE